MAEKILRLTNPGATEPLYSHTHAPLFDCCGDNDLMSLTVAGASPFLDWIGWQGTDVYRLVREYLLFTRAKATAAGSGVASAGWLCDPCADPNSVETEFCELEVEGFARLRRMGPTRDITKVGLNYCETSPRYRIDGVQISDDLEYDMLRATEVLIQDLSGLIVTGDADTCGQFDGLESLVKTGYDCCTLDSILIDWNESGMAESTGATWNGDPIPDDTSFINLLKALVRRIRQRVRMVPSLGGRNFVTGDIILVMPGSFIPCLLDAFTCYSVCNSGFFGSVWLNKEDRLFRDSLNGGMFGAGEITIEGLVIPIMPFDYGLINSGNTFDAYLLTRGIGNRRWLYGQYNNMNPVSARSPEYRATDGGRLLEWDVEDHTCVERVVEMQPRLVLEAPWAQVRISDISCDALGGPLSGDPWSEYFPYDCVEHENT